jgi:hypothetical protein
MNKSILEKALTQVPSKTFLGMTTVWNYYNSSAWSDLIKNKNSNLSKVLSDNSMYSDKYLSKGITILVGAKGRSAHSETQVLIFITDLTSTIGGTFFGYNDLVEMGVR